MRNVRQARPPALIFYRLELRQGGTENGVVKSGQVPRRIARSRILRELRPFLTAYLKGVQRA